MIEHYLLPIQEDANQKNLVVLVHVPNIKNHTVKYTEVDLLSCLVFLFSLSQIAAYEKKTETNKNMMTYHEIKKGPFSI